MFRYKSKITQEEYDKGLQQAFKTGYEMGQLHEIDRQWASQHGELTLPEKQVLAILQRKGVQ